MANDISGSSLNAVTPATGKEPTRFVRSDQDSQAVTGDTARVKDGHGEAVQQSGKSDLEQSVKDLNNLVQNLQRELSFSVDEQSGEVVVKVVDQTTKELVRQIPAEEVLRVRQRLEQATGALFSDKV
jgi:flagellar protein FlaG